jgi:hypothetical protein
MLWVSKKPSEKSSLKKSSLRLQVPLNSDGFGVVPKVTQGGILMDVREESIELEDYEVGEFYVSMVLRNRASNWRWEMLIVYGPAQHEKSREFIAELSRKCLYATLPMVLGGDFNLIRNANEKNNSNFDQSLMDRFNMFIELHNLQEIKRTGPRFTWTNKQKNPVMADQEPSLLCLE